MESVSFKYFGVAVDRHLSFYKNIEPIVNKVSRKLGVFRPLRISIPMAAVERSIPDDDSLTTVM